MGEGGLGILWPDLPPPNGLQRSLPALRSLRLCDESCSLGAHLLCGKAVLESWQSHQGRIKIGVRGSGVNRARYLHYMAFFFLSIFLLLQEKAPGLPVRLASKESRSVSSGRTAKRPI